MMDANDFASEVGPAVAESLDNMQTTTVDGRQYVSIEDLLGLVHAGLDGCEELIVESMMRDMLGDPDAALVAERAHATGLLFATFDHILHALEDQEAVASLSPGDFQ